MTTQYLLAIDQGTSGTKALIFDTQGGIVAKGVTPLKSSYPQAGYVEQDPEGLYRNVLASVRSCLTAFKQTGGSPEAIAACGISNQRETFMVWDRAGRPLHPAVVWQCNRSVEVCNRLKESGLEGLVKEKTGLILDPYFSGTKVIWLYENNGAIREAIHAGDALFGTVDAWLLYRLTGGEAYRTDYTNACRTLFFNIHTLSWDRDLVDAFGLKGLQFPKPMPSAAAYGRSDFEGLFPGGLKIAAMIGDSHASAFGQCCFDPGSAKVTLGTGSSVLMNTGRSVSGSDHGMMSTICWSTQDRVDYALEGIIISAGSTLTWLRDQLGLYAEVEELVRAPECVADTAGVYLIPAFAGLGAPHWRMGARAEIVGLTFGSNKQHILRAALESIPFQIKDVIAAMEADAGVRLQTLMADGGISQNGFVMQFLADLLAASVVQRGIEEVSAFGAACLAGLSCGVFEGLDRIQALETAPRTYSPGDALGAKAAYAGWEAILNG